MALRATVSVPVSENSKRPGGLTMNVRLVINPESDTAFVAAVHREVPDVRRTGELEHRLRTSYPNARVSNGVREPDGRPRWYVYRDGHWRADDGGGRPGSSG